MKAIHAFSLTLTLAAGPMLTPAAESRLPNIVIIFTDDQGYADVGVFGAKGFKTPNLDRMAKDGLIPGVIYMSGYDDPAKMSPVLRSGAPLLHKPFTLHALVVVLRSVIEKRSGH